jgi:hypothetical protein
MKVYQVKFSHQRSEHGVLIDGEELFFVEAASYKDAMDIARKEYMKSEKFIEPYVLEMSLLKLIR